MKHTLAWLWEPLCAFFSSFTAIHDQSQFKLARKRPRPALPTSVVDVSFKDFYTFAFEGADAQTLSSIDEIRETLHNCGLREAALNYGSTIGLKAGLNTIVAERLLDRENSIAISAEQRKKVIQIKQLHTELNKNIKRQIEYEKKRTKHENKLIDLRRDLDVFTRKARILTDEEKGVSRGTLKLYMGTIILTCLIVFIYYLTQFYLYPTNWILRARDAAIAGEDISNVFTNVFNTPEALQAGVHYIYAFFAVAFTVMGQTFLNHVPAKFTEKKQVFVWVTLSMIFITDGILAYHLQYEQISVKVFMGLAKEGELSPFNGEMLLSVLLGFGCTLAGSQLSSRYVALIDLKNHTVYPKIEVALIKAEIDKLTRLQKQIMAELASLREHIQQIVKAISSIIKELKSLILNPILQLRLFAYYSGYTEYIQRHYGIYSPAQLAEMSITFQRIFLTNP